MSNFYFIFILHGSIKEIFNLLAILITKIGEFGDISSISNECVKFFSEMVFDSQT